MTDPRRAPRPDPVAWLAGLIGWRRRGTAILLGVIATLALPPAHVFPALIPAFAGLIWLTGSAGSRRAAFGAGWWFGLGYFTIGLYWIAFALLTDAARFGWLVPFAVLGLAAGFAIYIGLATLALHLTRARGLSAVLFFAVFWTAGEYLRGLLFTGFPWNLVGHTWAFSDGISQSAALIGIYGLSLLTALAAAVPAVAVVRRDRRIGLAATLAMALLLAGLWAGGAWRLSGALDDTVPGVQLRIVQPNIRQADKWRGDLRDGHLAKTIELSRSPGFETVTHVIWPETAIPFFIAEDHARREILRAAIPAGGLLLAGAPRLTRNGAEPQVWNSMHAFAPSGDIVATYDKFHLVPFGEYMPLKSILPLDKITAGSSDFSPGPGLATLRLPGLPPVSPLICYEGIFPGAVARTGDRPGWLLNITNDAWFGISAGPHQHFAATRFRAIEEGLPLVRAANNGISAIVDPYGRIRDSLPLGATGIIDSPLPAALPVPPAYARLGDAVPAAMALIMLLLAGISGWRRNTTDNS